MKKIIICIMIILCLCMVNVNAAKININNDYDKGETLIAKITGNFEEAIIKDNVYLYKTFERIPIDIKDIKKINNAYFLYAPLDKQKGNYSLKIKDTFYWDIGNIIDEDLVQNFTITNQTADFSIKPGVIYTNEDFTIELTNLKDSDLEIEISNNFSEKEDSWFSSSKETEKITLSARDKKEIAFDISNISQNYYEIQLISENTKYNIPNYIIPLEKETSNKKEFKFIPNNLEIFILTNFTEKNTTVKIKNTLNKEVKNIDINISNNLKNLITLSQYNIISLEPNESKSLTLFINSNNYSEQFIQGNIIAISNEDSSENIKDVLDIKLNITKTFISQEEIENYSKGDEYLEETCESVNGNICSSGEDCNGTIKNLEDGNCCIGECIKKEKQSTIGQKITGYLLLIFILIFISWFFIKRFKHTKRKTNLLDTAKKGIFSSKK